MAVIYSQSDQREKEKLKAVSVRVDESMGRIHRHLMDCPFMFSVSLKFSKSKNKHSRGKDSLRRSQMILPNFSGPFCDGRWGPLLSCCGHLGSEAPSSPKLVQFSRTCHPTWLFLFCIRYPLLDFNREK